MSSLLHRIVKAHRCRSTHHFIVMAALERIDGDHADGWRDMLLVLNQSLLDGAKAPDTTFKDFKNHVLHVAEGEWGGARDAAMEWYGKSVEALALRKWRDAAYAMGVLSHYYADVIHPFHTGQTEEESAIHRAVEWSIAKSQDDIAARVAAKGYPAVEAGDGAGFVSDMVLAGARLSHRHYRTLIDHFDFDAAVKNPKAGLDEHMLDVVSDLFAYAASGVALLFSRAIAESGMVPPRANLTVNGYLATLDIPIRKLARRLADGADRNLVEAMHKELKDTGKVIRNLPADDRAIRKMHAQQVLRVHPAALDARPLEPLGAKHVSRIEKTNDARPSRTVAAPPFHAAEEGQAAIPPQAAPLKTPPKQAEPVRAAAPATPPEPKPEPVAPAATAPPPADRPDARPAARPRIKIKPEAPPTDARAAAEKTVETVASAAPDPAPDPVAETTDDMTRAQPKPSANTRRSKPLTLDSSVVDAPSIGRKTANRLGKVGIKTVRDLVEADVTALSEALGGGFMTPDVLADWQDQAQLLIDMPSLRAHDAQVLVGAGIRCIEDLAEASAADVFDAATAFVQSPSGARAVGDSVEPDPDEIDVWIEEAQAVFA